ncbi:unnamed protein product [Camellia sinensis]
MADQSTPVTGYPAAGYPHPPPQSGNNTNGYPPAGASYPYAAPPPQAAYYYAQPYPDPRATFLRRLFGILIASFIIAATIAFIVWLILRPRLPEFQVDSLSLSNFSLSSSSISANWDVGFTARNPNHKITLYYDDISATVFCGEQRLSDTAVGPFVQGTRNETTVRATFAANSAYVTKEVVDGINSDRSSRGIVNFNVEMKARVRYKAGAWRARQRFLRIFCQQLSVGVSKNSVGGTLIGGPRQCKVVIFIF